MTSAVEQCSQSGGEIFVARLKFGTSIVLQMEMTGAGVVNKLSRDKIYFIAIFASLKYWIDKIFHVVS